MTDAQFEEHTTHLMNYLQDKLRLLDTAFAELQTNMDTEVILPPTEVKENPLEENPPEEMPGALQQEETGQGDADGERGLMDYRFPAVLLVMCGSGMLLWYRCRKTGK